MCLRSMCDVCTYVFDVYVTSVCVFYLKVVLSKLYTRRFTYYVTLRSVVFVVLRN